MLDQHQIELIQAGVDGELGPDQRRQLDDLLGSSPEASQLHSELLRLGGFLDSLPEQRPPHGLFGKILDQIRLPANSSVVYAADKFTFMRPLAMGSAFAAGLLLAVGFYELGPGASSTGDLSQMVGTALLDRDAPASDKPAALVLQESWISGSVTLEEQDSFLVLNFDLDSNATAEVELGLADAGLKFAGIAREQVRPVATDEDFEVSGGTVRVENRGRQSFVIFLRRMASTESSQDIRIRFSSGDRQATRKLVQSS